jgi:Cys-tRNA(Pro)/Cys-tRNA(Cys) deacylase
VGSTRRRIGPARITGGLAIEAPKPVLPITLAAASGAKRADIIRLTPEEVAEVFGAEAGSVSPIALRGGVEVFFDAQVSTDETVFCGIGRADRTLEIHLTDLVQITHGHVLPLINQR